MKKQIQTSKAPAAIGPYSQAIQFESLLFTSGQIALDPQTKSIAGNTVQEQTHQVMKNLDAILKEAGSDFSKVLKTTVFLADMELFKQFNEVYESYFKNAIAPARSTVAVKGLPMNVLVEIECIASLK